MMTYLSTHYCNHFLLQLLVDFSLLSDCLYCQMGTLIRIRVLKSFDLADIVVLKRIHTNDSVRGSDCQLRFLMLVCLFPLKSVMLVLHFLYSTIFVDFVQFKTSLSQGQHFDPNLMLLLNLPMYACF